MNNSYSFDTSMFARNDEQLAYNVSDLCDTVGFKGLNNVRLPYLQAKAFVNRHGVVYSNIEQWQFSIAAAKHDRRLNAHIDYIQEYMTMRKSINSFLARIKHINDLMRINNNQVARVAYELLKEMGN